MKKTTLSLICFFTFSLTNVMASDIRAGDLRVEQLSVGVVRVTVNLYTTIHSSARMIQLCWGDGQCEDWISEFIQEWPEIDTRHYQLQAIHGYENPGMVTITAESCCWTGDIKNMAATSLTPFTLESHFLVSNLPDQLNTNPDIQPYFTACTSEDCSYTPNANDLEGDKLHWALCDVDVPGYKMLDEVFPGPGNNLFYDSENGRLSWVNPPVEGLFSVFICITEIRDGLIISETGRFVLIIVDDDLVLNTQGPKQETPFFIAPNPVGEAINFEEISEGVNGGKLRIYNASGQIFFEGTFSKNIPASSWPSGTYLLIFEKKDQLYFKNFIKG